MRATSETTGKSAHKTVAFNKKLSLPLTPSPSAPKNDVSSVSTFRLMRQSAFSVKHNQQ